MKIVRWFITILLFFIYMYSLTFRILPINSKIVLEAIGLLLSLPYILSQKYVFKKKYKWILRFALVIIVWDCFVCMFNGTSRFLLTQAMVTPIGGIFGSQVLYMYTQKDNIDERFFFVVISWTIFIESILVLMANFVPPFGEIVRQVLVPSDGAIEVTDIVGYYRLVGIGNAVAFGAISSFALGIFSIVYVIITSRSVISQLLYLLMYIVVALVTFLTVRTSIAITLLSFMLLLYYLFKKKSTTAIWVVLGFALLVVLAYTIMIKTIDDSMFEWAFGFLISKDLDSGSQGAVIEWWRTIHFEFKTFIMGDGLYEGPNGMGYYGETDIGFFRQIFYGGIIGLALMLYYHYKILLYAYKSSPSKLIGFILFSLFLSLIIMLAKGDANMLTYFILLLVFLDGGLFHKKMPDSVQRAVTNSSH